MILVPLQMVSQTWDDHDRSGRYTCRDFGANYLESMQREGHPIILTNGDNDTFPLWYNHEVEGVRTDTRDVNMEYLQTNDWRMATRLSAVCCAVLTSGSRGLPLSVLPVVQAPSTLSTLGYRPCSMHSP